MHFSHLGVFPLLGIARQKLKKIKHQHSLNIHEGTPSDCTDTEEPVKPPSANGGSTQSVIGSPPPRRPVAVVGLPGGVLVRSGTSTAELPFIIGIHWTTEVRAGWSNRLVRSVRHGRLCRADLCSALWQLSPLEHCYSLLRVKKKTGQCGGCALRSAPEGQMKPRLKNAVSGRDGPKYRYRYRYR